MAEGDDISYVASGCNSAKQVVVPTRNKHHGGKKKRTQHLEYP